GISVGFDLVDDPKIRKLRRVRKQSAAKRSLIDVLCGHQAMRRAAYVADLEQQRPTQCSFYVQVVVVIVGSAKVLADGEDVEHLPATRAGRAVRVRRSEDWHSRLNRIRVGWQRLYRRGTRRVSFQSVRRAVCRAVIQERVQVWC